MLGFCMLDQWAQHFMGCLAQQTGAERGGKIVERVAECACVVRQSTWRLESILGRIARHLP